jgi:hypothetical protein
MGINLVRGTRFGGIAPVQSPSAIIGLEHLGRNKIRFFSIGMGDRNKKEEVLGHF